MEIDVVVKVQAHREKHNPHSEMWNHISQEVIPHYFPNLPKLPKKPKVIIGRPR